MTEQPTPTAGKTPAGQIAVETPTGIRPNLTDTWGAAYAFLGDPENRYSHLVASADRLSMSVKMRMLTDPVIAMSVAFIASKLVKAEYEIDCEDEKIKRFFSAMYGAFHREFMLQAAMAVPLGSVGLIKRFKFDVPDPEDVGDPPVWNSPVTPFICTGFDQVNPVGAYPKFAQAGSFEGFRYSEGDVDRIYALWLTIGRAKVFGKYKGRGRLENTYKPWWIGEFSDDQLVVHIQKFVDRVVQVLFPPGKDEDGNDVKDYAIALGDDIRGGATAVLPSTVYTVEDEMGYQKLTAIRKWAVSFLEATENVAAFTGLSDHISTRKAMGMLIPLQLYQAVQQSALGGPTTSDVLGKLAVDLIIQDAVDIDTHLNKYLFPYILAANYGPDAPKVTKKTTGLSEYDRGEMFELLKLLVDRVDSDAQFYVDVPGLIHTLGVPEVEEPVIPEKKEPEPVIVQVPAGAAPAAEETGNSENLENQEGMDMSDHKTGKKRKKLAYDPKKNPPREVLEKLLSERLADDSEAAAEITDADIDRAVERLYEEVPEAENLETVEVFEPEDKNAGS